MTDTQTADHRNSLAALASAGCTLITDPALLESYRSDQCPWISGHLPIAVAQPRSRAQAQAIMRSAHRENIPVVIRGAGSGLAGGAAAMAGSLVISTAHLTATTDIDISNHLLTVQAGVLTKDVKAAAADVGLWYPPDPASWEYSTIGGNVATNAGGLCCLKYGVTRDYVLAIDVVLPDGRETHLGRNTLKGVAGLDLVSLFVGSEGTLGLLTGVTLRLRPAPRPASTIAAFFPDLATAGEALLDVLFRHAPSVAEIMDGPTLQAASGLLRMPLDPWAALLLIQLDAQDTSGELAAVEATLTRAGAGEVFTTMDPDEGEQFLALRRAAYPALEALGTAVLDDVAVPRANISALLEAIQQIARDTGLLIATFGHAGDGNMHPTLVYSPGDADAALRARGAFDMITQKALDMGGTITGEHGVGQLKRHDLGTELDTGAAWLHHAIKNTIDPTGLLGPGKLYPTAHR